MARFFSRVQIRSRDGVPCGHFAGCTAYFDNGRFIVVLRHCRGARLCRPFPAVTLDPPTIEVDNPQNYEGFVPLGQGPHRTTCP